MTDHKKIDDKDLEDISGAGSGLDVNIQADPDAKKIGPRNGPPQPGTGGSAGGGGADEPESQGGGGGNQDLQI